ncbi:MAG: ATP-binding protein [Actinoallomurus sp.]
MTRDLPYGPRRSEPRALDAAPRPTEPPDLPPILDQSFDGEALYALRSAVEAHTVAAGMPQGRAEDVVICVHELATNAIRHGAGTGRLRVWRLSGRLRCQVDDDGAPTATRDEPALVGDGAGSILGGPGPQSESDGGRGGAGPSGGDPADRWPYRHGHGLWLIRCAADGFSVRSGQDGTRAVLTFALPEPGPRPPFRLAPRPVKDGDGADRGRVVLVATGDLDRDAGAELLAAAAGLVPDAPYGGGPELVLDLRGLAFWDTAGIASLSALQHRVRQIPSGTLTVVLGETSLRERLRYAGLAEGLILVDQLDDTVGRPEDADPGR